MAELLDLLFTEQKHDQVLRGRVHIEAHNSMPQSELEIDALPDPPEEVAKVIAWLRAIIKQFLANTKPGLYLPIELLTFSEDTPLHELQALRRQVMTKLRMRDHEPQCTRLSTIGDVVPCITKDKVKFIFDRLPIRGPGWAREYMAIVEGFDAWPQHVRRAVEDAERSQNVVQE